MVFPRGEILFSLKDSIDIADIPRRFATQVEYEPGMVRPRPIITRRWCGNRLQRTAFLEAQSNGSGYRRRSKMAVAVASRGGGGKGEGK